MIFLQKHLANFSVPLLIDKGGFRLTGEKKYAILLIAMVLIPGLNNLNVTCRLASCTCFRDYKNQIKWPVVSRLSVF